MLSLADLADQAAELCRQTITHVSEPAQVLDWIRFLDAPASGAPALMDNGSRSNTPQQQQSLYGPHTATLRQTLMHHLTHVLPVSMCAFATKHSQSSSATGGSPVVPSQASSAASQEAQQQLSAIYSLLPFNLFKVIVESPQFPPGDMERVSHSGWCFEGNCPDRLLFRAPTVCVCQTLHHRAKESARSHGGVRVRSAGVRQHGGSRQG